MTQTKRVKRQPIVVGDGFKDRNGVVWTVTEAMGFGRGYWMISDDRCKQYVSNRFNLELMERAQGIRLCLSA